MYSIAPDPIVAAQVLASMKMIMGKDGTTEGRDRIQTLAENTKFFRQELVKMGFIVYGGCRLSGWGSPRRERCIAYCPDDDFHAGQD
jgi:hypothetical protein